uniref:Uncharacterized protein n=1 Tax=viral metagenome TaxID=1070528 RepID=A0A2V0RIR4_9ZZZZ
MSGLGEESLEMRVVTYVQLFLGFISFLLLTFLLRIVVNKVTEVLQVGMRAQLTEVRKVIFETNTGAKSLELKKFALKFVDDHGRRPTKKDCKMAGFEAKRDVKDIREFATKYKKDLSDRGVEINIPWTMREYDEVTDRQVQNEKDKGLVIDFLNGNPTIASELRLSALSKIGPVRIYQNKGVFKAFCSEHIAVEMSESETEMTDDEEEKHVHEGPKPEVSF